MSAADWLEVIWDEEFTLLRVFPDLAGNEAIDAMYEDMFEGKMTLEEVCQISLESITELSGYDYWVTLRACFTLREAWIELGGRLLSRGVDPQKMSLGAYLTAMFALLVDKMEPKKTVQFFESLREPPETEEEARKEMQIDDSALFMKAMREAL